MAVSSGFYILTGEDEFRKALALKRLKAELIGAKGDCLNYESYEAGSCAIDDVIASVGTLSMAGIKVVALKEPEALEDEDRERLLAYLRSGPKSKNCFVLLSRGARQKDEEFLKELARYAKRIEFANLGPDELLDWIIKEFKQRKKVIDRRTAQILALAGSRDLGRISSIIEEASLFAGEREKIGEEDILVFSDMPPEATTYKLLDAISEKDTGRSLSVLKSLISSENSPLQILGLLNWHISSLIAVKKMLLAKAARHRISSLMNMSEGKISRLISQAESVTLKQLRENLDMLLETDILIKRSGLRADYLVEMLVARLSTS